MKRVPVVPRSWHELTPAWLTAALAPSCPGAVVAEAEIVAAADGTNRRARVRLSYSAGGGPGSVFVKLHGRMRHRLALVALGAFAAEARLAGSGVALPVERPRPYAAGVDWRALATIVVMEDIASRGGRANDGESALPVAQVRAGLAELARLHAAYWDRPLPGPLGFVRPWRLGRAWAPVSLASVSRGLRRVAAAGDAAALPARIRSDPRLLERQFRGSATLAATGPRTVLHGDPHPGNTYWLPGDRTGFLDWQLVRAGNWSHDVGYFLAGSLGIADRRQHDSDLLAGYLDELRRAGVEAPGFGHAWARYRASPAFGLGTWLHTLAAGTFQPPAVCLATVRRFAAAYQDLETHSIWTSM
jgi:hypothetical protein